MLHSRLRGTLFASRVMPDNRSANCVAAGSVTPATAKRRLLLPMLAKLAETCGKLGGPGAHERAAAAGVDAPRASPPMPSAGQ